MGPRDFSISEETWRGGIPILYFSWPELPLEVGLGTTPVASRVRNGLRNEKRGK